MQIVLIPLAFLALLRVGHCDDHTYGTDNPGDKVLFEKVLFSQNLEKPKNYTIIFKYIGSESSPNITHAIFRVENAVSHGSIEVKAEKGKDRELQAMLSVINGTNVQVTGKIYGPSVSLFDVNSFGSISHSANNPKTMTVVYGHNATQTRYRKFFLGRRQSGDKLIGFQSKNVTLSYRFAETEFKYHDDQKHITAVNFLFDSPSANAFINSTFIGEHGLDVIAYDLNTPYFMANMSVYGFDNFDKPSSYKPIVLSVRKGWLLN